MQLNYVVLCQFRRSHSFYAYHPSSYTELEELSTFENGQLANHRCSLANGWLLNANKSDQGIFVNDVAGTFSGQFWTAQVSGNPSVDALSW